MSNETKIGQQMLALVRQFEERDEMPLDRLPEKHVKRVGGAMLEFFQANPELETARVIEDVVSKSSNLEEYAKLPNGNRMLRKVEDYRRSI